MRSFAAIAAFAAGTNALVGRSDSCCFDLTASGEASGTLGQLSDGQVRLGDNSLSAAKFCINSSGGITDSEGRGCVVTTETTQFQCDTGASPTTGFSISSSGELEYNGSPYFIGCETGQNGGRNIYTTNSTSVTQCKNIELTADSCSGSGAGSGSGSSASASASSLPQSSSLPHSTAPMVPSNSAAPSGGSSPSGGGSSGGSSPSGGGSGGSGSPAPSGGESIVPSAPAPSASSPPLSGSPIYVTSTVTVTDCHCPTAPAGGAGAPSSTPSFQTSPAGGGGGGGGGAVGGGSGPSGTPAPHGSSAPSGVVPESPAPHSTSAPVGGGGGGGVAPSGTPAHSSAPHGSPAPSGTPVPQSSVGPSPSAPAVSSTPARSVPATTSMVASSTAPQSSSVASGTSSASGSCATTLIEAPSQYQYPHLIVPVNSTTPNTAYGTQYFGTVSSTVSTIFNFDIPSSWSGSTCNLVFLFPEKADLETSDYTFSGDGKLDFSKLSEVATTDTTYASTPSVSENLGDITISAGNSYVVSTFSCPAGEAVAYEISEGGTTDLYWFNDWNPSPLGIFITKC